MFVTFYVGALVYCAVTLVFLILSSDEAPGSGLSSLSRLTMVFFAAVFWPVTLFVLCLSSALSLRTVPGPRRVRTILPSLAPFLN
ncbi:MAG: hypothetical protein Tsb0019_39350 [Roseibium sp.]